MQRIIAGLPEAKARKFTPLPQRPEDWPRLFSERLNAGDLDAVMELHEPEAQFVARSGETLVGRDRIREPLGAMIQENRIFKRPLWLN